MTNKKFFEQTISNELPRFERVFAAIPDDPKDLRAHPKNKNAKELVETLAYESMIIPTIFETGEFDFELSYPKDPKTVSEMAGIFKKNFEKAKKMAMEMSEEEWDTPGKFLTGSKVEWEAPKGILVWDIIFDAIHHRGQLSTHIRPQGGKVPAIYGPSGDMGM